MRNKKAISIALSAVMAFTTAFGMTTVKANAEEKEKIVVYVAAEGKNASGSAVEMGKTAVQLDEGAVAEDAIKAALDKSAYKDNYKISTSAWGDSLDSISDLNMYNVGNDWYYWSFCVNGQYANLGISSQKVNDNDKISLIYSYDNYNTSAACFNDDTSKNPEGFSAYSEKAKKAQDVLAQKIYDTTFKGGEYVPGVEDSSGLYTVFSLARAGFKADKFYDSVYAKVKAQLGAIKTSTGKFYDDTNKKYVSQESILKDGAASQTYAKIALCVTALGKDASNVNGFNLIEKLADKSVYEASSIYSRETTILMAIDSKNYELPTGDNYFTRAELVNKTVADTDNQIATSIDWNSIDSAVMQIQPLCAYQTKDVDGVDKSAVKKACDKVLNFMYNKQGADGTYGDSYSASNVWTTAQVMITAGLFGIDAATEENGTDFIKNGVTLYDDALAFVDTDNNTVDEKLMSFQPEQLLRGFNAAIRASEKTELMLPVETAEYTASDDATYTLPTEKVTPVKLAKAKITKLTAGKKQLTVKFAKVKLAKSYKVQVSTDKKFKKNVTIKTTKKTSLTIKKLKSNKKYYVRVQAVSGKNTGAYSAVKNVKIK
ncbi:MAG: DUF4430 domain-containing protein [Christensenellales bacterium]|jgi:hypothetical protein|nr:putative uncharacterized protein [Clostridium sp. CAG:253]